MVSTVFGVERYSSLEEKAALAAWIIIDDHVFHDGSKRTAMSSLELLLNYNGLTLEASEEEIIDISLEIAKGRSERSVNLKEFTEWIGQRVREKKPPFRSRST